LILSVLAAVVVVVGAAPFPLVLSAVSIVDADVVTAPVVFECPLLLLIYLAHM
jgi:hypothetical protein